MAGTSLAMAWQRRTNKTRGRIAMPAVSIAAIDTFQLRIPLDTWAAGANASAAAAAR